MPKKSKTTNHSAPPSSAPADNVQTASENDELKKPTDLAALADGPSYVRAVAAKVDLVGASAKLVVSNDEKIAKGELDRLRELIFGKGGPPPADEVLQIDWSAMTRSDPDLPGLNGQGQGEPRDHN